MKILWVKSGGFLPLDAGGKIRSFNIARELAKRHELTVFTFYPAVSPDLNEQLGAPFFQVERVRTKVPRRASVVDALRYASNALTTQPYQIRKYCTTEAKARLQELVQQKSYDAILCDYLVTAGVLPWSAATPVVILAHNVEAELWRRRAIMAADPLRKFAAWREYRTIARAERRYSQLADHVLTVSEEDRNLFLEFLPPHKVTPTPTGVDLDYFRPAEVPESSSLVFTGSMDWRPNEDAVVYFSDKILPLLQRGSRNVTLTIVGKDPTARVWSLARQPGIRITGPVDDIRPYVQGASVFVVPLRIGGGTRIKIFEALAMGKAVVSTRIGAEGLPVTDGDNIVLADSPEEFAQRTLDLLDRPEERQHLGAAGRALVESGYGWSAVADVVERALFGVLARRANKLAAS